MCIASYYFIAFSKARLEEDALIHAMNIIVNIAVLLRVLHFFLYSTKPFGLKLKQTIGNKVNKSFFSLSAASLPVNCVMHWIYCQNKNEINSHSEWNLGNFALKYENFMNKFSKSNGERNTIIIWVIFRCNPFSVSHTPLHNNWKSKGWIFSFFLPTPNLIKWRSLRMFSFHPWRPDSK